MAFDSPRKRYFGREQQLSGRPWFYCLLHFAKNINRSVALNRRPEKGMAETQSVAESALVSMSISDSFVNSIFRLCSCKKSCTRNVRGIDIIPLGYRLSFAELFERSMQISYRIFNKFCKHRIRLDVTTESSIQDSPLNAGRFKKDNFSPLGTVEHSIRSIIFQNIHTFL